MQCIVEKHVRNLYSNTKRVPSEIEMANEVEDITDEVMENYNGKFEAWLSYQKTMAQIHNVF